MSLLNRRAGLLAAGPNAVRANAMRQQEALLGRARAPSVIGAPTSVITEENPLNEFGKGMTLFAKTLDARRQRQLENQLARQKMAREQMLASSLVASRQAQAASTVEQNRIRLLALQQQNILARLRETGLNDRQKAALAAELDKTQMQLANALKIAGIRGATARDVQGMRNEGAINLQGARNEGAMNVQRLRNTGQMNVQGARNEGAMNVQNARNQGAMNVANVRKEGVLGAARIRADAAQARARAARNDKKVTTLTVAEKVALGYRPNDLVQMDQFGGVTRFQKDALVLPSGQSGGLLPPLLPDIKLPEDTPNLASAASGLGRLGQKLTNFFNFGFGSPDDPEPAAEAFATISSVNNQAINIGSALETAFDRRLTNFARQLTAETLPQQETFQTPRQYVTKASKTAATFKGLADALEKIINDPLSTRKDLRAARARLPEIRQLANFYETVVEKTQDKIGGNVSSNVRDADRIVGFGGGSR